MLYYIFPEPYIINIYPTFIDEFSNMYIDDVGICYKYKKIYLD